MHVRFFVMAVGPAAPALSVDSLRQAGGEEKETQDLNDGAFLGAKGELSRRR